MKFSHKDDARQSVGVGRRTRLLVRMEAGCGYAPAGASKMAVAGYLI
jgi:hypothetical protein